MSQSQLDKLGLDKETRRAVLTAWPKVKVASKGKKRSKAGEEEDDGQEEKGDIDNEVCHKPFVFCRRARSRPPSWRCPDVYLSTSVNLGHKAEEEKAFSSTRRIRDRRPGHSHGSRASVFAEVGLWGVAL